MMEPEHHGDSDGSKDISVDICATLLTKTAPKLPLREELPSLGFEVIYKAAGVGVKASKHEAHKAARAYRRQEEIRELKKRRFFPKSSKRIKEKMEERKRVEKELAEAPRALSYEAYRRELHHYDSDTGSSSGCSSSGKNTATLSTGSKSSVKKYHSRLVSKHFGMLRHRRKKLRGKNSDNGDAPPSSVAIAKPDIARFESVVEEAAFQDYLAPAGHQFSSVTDTPVTSPTGTNNSHAHSTITSPYTLDTEHRFDSSPSGLPYLPALNTVEESGGAVEETKSDLFGKAYTELDKNQSAQRVTTDASHDPSSITTPIGMQNPNVKVVVAPGLDLPGLRVDTDALSPSTEGNEEVAANNPTTELSKNPTSPGTLGDTVKNAFANVDVTTAAANQGEGVLVEQAPVAENKTEAKLDNDVVEAFQGLDLDAKADDDAWLASARVAFESITNDLLKAVGVGIGSTEEEGTVPAIENDLQRISSEVGSIDALFSSISKPGTTAKDIQPLLEKNLDFVQVRRQEDGRFLLHTVCGKAMPQRTSVAGPSETLKLLLKDIADLKDLLILVQSINPDACLVEDSKGDLPVHLMARTFAEWEASWYETVYQEALKTSEKKEENLLAVTILYRSMSECVEMLLKPLASNDALCRVPGSVGTMIPLHIASIFTSSVPTLRMILETSPESATTRFKTGTMKSFIPDDSLPLELHVALSTDFPKWEVEAKEDSSPEIKWSQVEYHRHGFDDCIRRSDLLLAFNPIEPYCSEVARLRRFESRLQFEAKLAIEDNSKRLSRASELLWIWFCMPEKPRKDKARLESVKRIVEGLPLRSLRFLSSIETSNGVCVVDVADPECQKVIRRSMERLTESIVPIQPGSTQGSTLGSSEKSKASSSVLKTWDETQLARLSLSEKGLVKRLCDLIFSIDEVEHPKAFVILPYRLKLSEDGNMGIESIESASAAVKFADHLLQLTGPRSILYFIDRKARENFGQSIYENDDDPYRLASYETIKEQEEALLSLYAPGDAYLYLIDELTGIPFLTHGNTNYPIVLSESNDLIRDILPLMLVGMLQMRGEKALSILISVLLDDSISVLPKRWVDAAREVGAYLYSQKSKESSLSASTRATTDDLMEFVRSSEGKLRQDNTPKNATSEWDKELSLLKTLLVSDDPAHSYSGLVSMDEGRGLVVWTKKGAQPSAAPKGEGILKNKKSGPVDIDGVEDMIESEYTGPVDLDAIDNVMANGVLGIGGSSSSSSEEYRKSGPVDLDEMDDLMARRKGPVDLDEMDDRIAQGRANGSQKSSSSGSTSEPPSVDFLVSKHSELSKLYSQVGGKVSEHTPPLAFPQPHDDRSEDSHKRMPIRLVKSKYSTDSDEESLDSNLQDRKYEQTLQGSTSMIRSSVDDTEISGMLSSSPSGPFPTILYCSSVDETYSERKSRFSLLFEDLAIDEVIEEDEEEEREPEETETRGDEGERVYSDVMNSLLRSRMDLEDDVRVVRVKVELASVAEQLSGLSKRTSDLKSSQRMATMERSGLTQGPAGEWCKGGLNGASVSRKLLLRLTALEDRILADQIDTQHTALMTYVVREEMKAVVRKGDTVMKEPKGDISVPLPSIDESSCKGEEQGGHETAEEGVWRRLQEFDRVIGSRESSSESDIYTSSQDISSSKNTETKVAEGSKSSQSGNQAENGPQDLSVDESSSQDICEASTETDIVLLGDRTVASMLRRNEKNLAHGGNDTESGTQVSLPGPSPLRHDVSSAPDMSDASTETDIVLLGDGTVASMLRRRNEEASLPTPAETDSGTLAGPSPPQESDVSSAQDTCEASAETDIVLLGDQTVASMLRRRNEEKSASQPSDETEDCDPRVSPSGPNPPLQESSCYVFSETAMNLLGHETLSSPQPSQQEQPPLPGSQATSTAVQSSNNSDEAEAMFYAQTSLMDASSSEQSFVPDETASTTSSTTTNDEIVMPSSPGVTEIQSGSSQLFLRDDSVNTNIAAEAAAPPLVVQGQIVEGVDYYFDHHEGPMSFASTGDRSSSGGPPMSIAFEPVVPGEDVLSSSNLTAVNIARANFEGSTRLEI